jgi:hypothetical protein
MFWLKEFVFKYINEDDIHFQVPVWVWDYKLVFPSHDLSYKSIEDFNYALGLSSRNVELNGKVDNMWLAFT